MQYINLSEVTFTLWFKRNNLTATQDLFSLMNGLIRTTDSQILYWTNTAVGNKVLNYTPDTDWNFIAVTHERTNCRIYYNNISVAEFTNCRTIDTRDVTKTFGSYGPYNYLNGSMDDIRVFNRSLDSEAVMDIYYKGREASKLGSGVPILGYHRVDNIGTTYYTNLTDFADQMEWLNSSGYTTITFKHFVNYTLGLYELPDNPVILSFDDGNRNVYTNATPIMDLYDFVGCANIPTGSVGTAGKMNWTDLQNLSDKGWEIVSHSVTHSNFLTLSSAERIAEFNDSKNAIDGNISGYNTTSFIYPYTTFNETTNAEASVYYTFTGGLDNYIQNVRYWNYGYKYTNLYGGFERLAMANVTTFENFVKAVTQDNQLKIQYNFNENQGTDVHDVSGNGNNGTITGASWNNDGITVALTNLIDYTLVGSTFNLLTNLWDQVVVSYVYGDSHTVEAMNSNFTAGIDNVSEKFQLFF